MKIAFVGVGKMGLPMATHLRSAGHAVAAFDPGPAAQQRARQAGLEVAESFEAAAADAEVIVSSLSNDAVLLAVADQIAARSRGRCSWIDTSTVSVAASASAAERVAEAGVPHLRATVSGNASMAEAAQLTVMASGPRELYAALLPLLACWGPRQFYLGDAEQARLMKLVINLMIAHTTAALSEALTLGRKGGLEWSDLWAVISESAVASPIVKAKGRQLVDRDFSPTFTVEQMRKDLHLIMEAGTQLGAPLPLTSQVAAQQSAADEAGFGAEDYAAVIKLAEQAAGLPIDRT